MTPLACSATSWPEIVVTAVVFVAFLAWIALMTWLTTR